MAAWIVEEWVHPTEKTSGGRPKRMRKKVTSNMRGVRESDRFAVEWIDPDGKRCRQKIAAAGRPGKRLAVQLAEQITSKLTLGEYDQTERKLWLEFRKEYEKDVLAAKRPGTQRIAKESLNLFEKLCRPGNMHSITTRTVDSFKSRLADCPGKKRGSKMSEFTVNKHLRHIKAALRKAYKWEYISKLPEVEFLDEPEKSPVFMLSEDFDAIYAHCDMAKAPAERPYTPEDWWRALMVLGIMAGLRINEMMQLAWDDVNLDRGFLTVRHQVAKAKRDDVVPLHPVAVEHLRRIIDFGATVFDWPLAKVTLWEEWARIQQAAGIDLLCQEDHQHTPKCHVYGFHALKKACGTLNAGRLPRPVLNAFMRHSSFATTEKYYLNSEKLTEGATDMMFVPEVLRTS